VEGQYIGALFVSHYAVLVFLLQVIAGVLLLVNRFVPLAIALPGPIVVNILLFHFSNGARRDTARSDNHGALADRVL
jgi:hypothetical protein